MSTDANTVKETPPVTLACGIDFGTSEIAVAVSSADAPFSAQLVRNYMSNETTPGVVKIYENTRSYGEEAAATVTSCPQNVYSHFPLILANINKVNELKERYPDLCFSVREGEKNSLVMDVTNDADVKEVSLTHMISMLFHYIYRFVSEQYPKHVENTVIAVPNEIPQESVRAVLDAAKLAGFKNVRVVPTNAAQAYKYSLCPTTHYS